MIILLQGNIDARTLGIRSLKRVYLKIKNNDKSDNNIIKDQCKLTLNKNVFRVLELLHKKMQT